MMELKEPQQLAERGQAPSGAGERGRARALAALTVPCSRGWKHRAPGAQGDPPGLERVFCQPFPSAAAVSRTRQTC